MIKLYLIRHGETVHNVERRIQGHLDSPLTELGVRQAQLAAARLAGERFAAVYSSDLGRAMSTAGIIAARHDLPVISTDLLREAYFGEVQGWTSAEFEERMPEDYAKWRTDSSAHRPRGGEAVESVVSRCRRFIDEVLAAHDDGDQVMVVGHGGSVKALIVAACDMPLAMFSRLHTSNASLSILNLAERRSLWLLNDTCHLDSQVEPTPDADNPNGDAM